MCVLTHVCVLSAAMPFTDVLNLSGSGVSLFQKQWSHKLMWHFEPHPTTNTHSQRRTRARANRHTDTHTHTHTNQPPVKGRFHQSRFLSVSQLSQLYSMGKGRFGGLEHVCMCECVCMWRSCHTELASPSSLPSLPQFDKSLFPTLWPTCTHIRTVSLSLSHLSVTHTYDMWTHQSCTHMYCLNA